MAKTKNKKQKKKREEMNQLGLGDEPIWVIIHIYIIWKCHKETLCVAILNKNVILFFYKIREQED
jgi:hypothetical protein